MAGGGGGNLNIEYAYKTRPSTVLNTVFMSTVNTAAKQLMSVASNVRAECSDKWRPRDHLRFMTMLMTWFTVWAMRVLVDHLPSPMLAAFSPHKLLAAAAAGISSMSSSSSSSSSLITKALIMPPPILPATTSSTALLSTSGGIISSPSWDLIVAEDFDGPSVKGIGRALTQILALLNDIPATSRKYQFAMAMADKIMDGNFHDGHEELVEVNRTALSSAFARTLGLLVRSLQRPHDDMNGGTLTSRMITRAVRALPLGSYIATYAKVFSFCVKAVIETVKNGGEFDKSLVVAGGGGQGGEGRDHAMTAEKLAQELLWITCKLRTYGAVDEAMVHWSYASSLASLSFTANPRVQGLIVKISAMLFGDLPNEELANVSENVKFRLLVLWIPLFCHANNGVSYPVLTSFDKFEVERAMDEVISTLPPIEQEIVLTNWLRDFSISPSDWPNLQPSYDRWCQSTRQLVF